MTKTMMTVALVLAAAVAQAQQVSHSASGAVLLNDQAPRVLLDKVVLDHSQVNVETHVTPNAPYSAESVTESVQALADGNRIVHRTVSRVYRDSAGRTRRETVDADGQVTSVSISDPTTGTSVVFDPRGNHISRMTTTKTRTVVGTAAPASASTTAHAEGGTVWITSDAPAGQRTLSHVMTSDSASAGSSHVLITGTPLKGETSTEDLGQQSIEGVTAKGKRTTTVIPAGAIGNEQPIKIVSEEWFSPELQVLVMTRHADPRTGESTYRLTNVVRTEPASSLFEAPAKK